MIIEIYLNIPSSGQFHMILIYNFVLIQFHGQVFEVVIESLLTDIHKSWFDQFVFDFIPSMILSHPSKTFNHLVGVVVQVHHLKRLF
jgi:hypothetical protein